MSRIGKKPVAVPSGVTVTLKDHTVQVKGPQGDLTWAYPDGVSVAFDGEKSEIRVERANDLAQTRALHGMTRALLANMVEGVHKGYERKLEVYGTGYGAQVKGNQLLLNVGFMGRRLARDGSQREAQFFVDIPAGVKVDVEVPAARGDSDPAKFTIQGPDKQAVGKFAAEVRAIRPPEPYKGKGIRYEGEQVRRKQGKAFAGGG